MSWSLPKLPGFTFEDPTRTRFHVSRKFEYKNGFRIPKTDSRGIGGIPMDVDGSGQLEIPETVEYDPSLTYGRVKPKTFPTTLPHWVHYDKKKLTFMAYLRQSISESPLEFFRIRPVSIVYFLEDDTITVMEPTVKNSGLWQGKMVKRNKIPKNSLGEFWNWKDLNIGMDIPIFGKVFHIVSCDLFTKEYMKSQGIELADEEEMPDDPYTVSKELRKEGPHKTSKPFGSVDKLRRFLQNDGKVLTFDAIWDDRDIENGKLRQYQLFYFLYDNTIQIKEYQSKTNQDQFPILLRRTRVAKNWKERSDATPFISHEPDINDCDDSKFYRAQDLIVGDTIDILGRRFILCDCDSYSRSYYKNIFNIEQGPAIPLLQPAPKVQHERPIIPPHIGIGDPEDTEMSCVSFHSKAPVKDVIQYNLNANKNLRYLCEMISVHPEDKGRRFIMSYSPSTGYLKVDELALKNAGIAAGRFSKLARVKVPESKEYYNPSMFYIGAIIFINKHKFKIIGSDLYVLRFMMENPEKFPLEVIDNLRNYHMAQGNLKEELQAATIQLQGNAEESMNAEAPSELAACLKTLNVIEGKAGPSEKPPPKEPVILDMGYDEHLTHMRGRLEKCNLPSALQGLGSVGELAGLETNKEEISDSKDKPIVCFAVEGLPFHNTQTQDQINKGDDANEILRRKDDKPNELSPGSAAGRPSKMVTFAELPTCPLVKKNGNEKSCY